MNSGDIPSPTLGTGNFQESRGSEDRRIKNRIRFADQPPHKSSPALRLARPSTDSYLICAHPLRSHYLAPHRALSRFRYPKGLLRKGPVENFQPPFKEHPTPGSPLPSHPRLRRSGNSPTGAEKEAMDLAPPRTLSNTNNDRFAAYPPRPPATPRREDESPSPAPTCEPSRPGRGPGPADLLPPFLRPPSLASVPACMRGRDPK